MLQPEDPFKYGELANLVKETQGLVFDIISNKTGNHSRWDEAQQKMRNLLSKMENQISMIEKTYEAKLSALQAELDSVTDRNKDIVVPTHTRPSYSSNVEALQQENAELQDTLISYQRIIDEQKRKLSEQTKLIDSLQAELEGYYDAAEECLEQKAIVERKLSNCVQQNEGALVDLHSSDDGSVLEYDPEEVTQQPDAARRRIRGPGTFVRTRLPNAGLGDEY